jgi:hypothetical protein
LSCPHCREAARFVGYRPKGLLCLLGPIRPERAYYHCPHCHQGHCPGDAVIGLGAGDLTPGAAQAVSLAGAIVSFAEAAEAVLTRLAGLHVSEATAQRTTEAAGEELGRRLAAGETFGPARDWAWHTDAEGKTCAYVSLDATAVPQQGPGAAEADGRMATVAMVYNPIPDDRASWASPAGRRPPWQARYLAGLGGQAALGEPLRRQAAQVGMDRAERWIALSDGGAGLEDWLVLNFGRVEAVILDFYHASEHLGDLAKAWHGAGTEAAEAQHQRWSHRLKHEGGEAVLGELRALEGTSRPSAREVLRGAVTYFENQAHRMDYPSYVAKGWQIGSGPVESACKTVVGQRLKCAGMRWGEPGSDGVCHLRALFLSERGQWDAFWAGYRKAG